MRILVAHNTYQTPGGEDAVFKSEVQILRDNGHEVTTYQKSNAEINQFSFSAKIDHFYHLPWNREAYSELRKLIREFKPEIAHFHNTFFMMSPSVFYACKDENVPVVQSLHNFRMLCANGLLYRNNAVCEECLKHSLTRGIIHGCYRQSRVASALVVRMLRMHQRKGTWKNVINGYITATKFTKDKYVQAGIEDSRIYIKPNFVYPEPEASVSNRRDKYALYVGRLDHEKGIDVLLNAWEQLREYPLKIVGKGPLLKAVKKQLKDKNMDHIELMGYVDQKEYSSIMGGAKFLILPSVCYENFPRIVAEAFAYGLPILSSRLGSLKEVITESETGLFFETGNSEDLVVKARGMFSDNNVLLNMGEIARQHYNTRFSSKVCLKKLMDIYRQVISGL